MGEIGSSGDDICEDLLLENGVLEIENGAAVPTEKPKQPKTKQTLISCGSAGGEGEGSS